MGFVDDENDAERGLRETVRLGQMWGRNERTKRQWQWGLSRNKTGIGRRGLH